MSRSGSAPESLLRRMTQEVIEEFTNDPAAFDTSHGFQRDGQDRPLTGRLLLDPAEARERLRRFAQALVRVEVFGERKTHGPGVTGARQF